MSLNITWTDNGEDCLAEYGRYTLLVVIDRNELSFTAAWLIIDNIADKLIHGGPSPEVYYPTRGAAVHGGTNQAEEKLIKLMQDEISDELHRELTHSTKTKVIILGSNPSVKSHDNSAFHKNTKSRKTIDKWFKDIDCDIVFLNVSTQKNKGNKPLTKTQLNLGFPILKSNLDNYPGHKIVALGKTASKALTLLCAEFFEMPHPSGTNRLLNDKKFVEQKISELKEFINGQ